MGWLGVPEQNKMYRSNCFGGHMGAETLEKLRSEALLLPPAERAELAHALVTSLDAPEDADAADAWEREILRRLDKIDSGGAKIIDRDEYRRRMRARMRR
jgi:putative addiction module component (TIGR02574 family)